MACSAVPARAGPAPARPLVVQVLADRPGHTEAGRQAAEQERRRLARDLHDNVIQQVIAARLTIDWCLAEVPAGSPLHAKLEDARRLVGIAARRLRSSLETLTDPPRPDDEDLPDMLRHLLAFPHTHELDLSVEVSGTSVMLPAPVRRSLQRAASECLFNAARHAGARRAVIRLRYGPGVIALSVADDGHGDPEALRKIIRGDLPGTVGYHFGLADVACRAEEVGGTIRVGPSDLGGIAVEVLVPIPGDADD
jgi:signal transduction histidine kinase